MLGAYAAAGQTEKSLRPADERGSFTLAPGSTFSASGRSGEIKPARTAPMAIKAISNDLDELLQVVKNNHVQGRKFTDESLVGSAITSMLQQLDPHSNYYTRSEFQDLNQDHERHYYGIGTTITNFTNNGNIETYVIGVTPNTPAFRAGLRFGDRIVAVNAQSVSGLDSSEVRDRVRGPLGTSVRLTFERGDGCFTRNVAIRRADVAQNSVSQSLMLENGVGYIALPDGFGYSTAAEVDLAFAALKRNGIKSLVIDLRGNGGGLMDQAILIAERFLHEGQTIVTQRGRSGAETREWKSRNRRPETMPLALLVDDETASASEILAAAMQDNDRGVIVGEKTFGKGLVQNIIPLEDGSGLTLTSERYYTPSGRSIQREYSDSGLYDYFRHTNRGTLIDRSSFAARTRTGRVVYGGDGIQPDVVLPNVEFTKANAKTADQLFHFYRLSNSRVTDADLIARFCDTASMNDVIKVCGNDRTFLFRQIAELKVFESVGSKIAVANALKIDSQMQAAIKSLLGK